MLLSNNVKLNYRSKMFSLTNFTESFENINGKIK